MNGQSLFPCGRVEPICDRRRFLERAGGGLGILALADLLTGQSRLAAAAPAGRAAAADALPAQGQIGHLAVHGRGTQRRRCVRSQA